jgi:hypothetical protein
MNAYGPRTVWRGGKYPGYVEQPTQPEEPKTPRVVKAVLLDLIERNPGMSRLEIQVALGNPSTNAVNNALERQQYNSRVKYVWVKEISPTDRTKQSRRIKRWYPFNYDTSKLK